MTDRESIRAWRDNWLAVAEIKRDERRHETVEARWQELEVLVRSAQELGLQWKRTAQEEADEEVISRRWETLHHHHLA